jgi:YidC/Oxa1 family membrane protein insertase
MLDPLFEAISTLLDIFYGLVPDYGFAIALLTCAVMLITTPLTLKGSRSMIEMQRIQPELRRLQAQYKGDRQKLNEEMMRLYQERGINPVGGCLPMLVQLPVFSILFYVVRGLTNGANFVGLQRSLGEFGIDPVVNSGFRPKYLDHDSELYQSLLGRDDMPSLGVDLAISPSQALGEGFLTALPYVLVVAVIALLSWYQQKQIMGRNRHAETTPQQQMMMRLGPVLYVMFAFISPAALCVYFLVSTVWRVAQQAYITHAHYKGEDSVGAQAIKAAAQARQERKQESGRTSGGNGARTAGKGRSSSGAGAKRAASTSRNGSAASPAKRQSGRAQAAGASTGASGSRAKPHPRSRKKKKRK